ncbi:leucine zipper domain-containing protein [Pseudonocardia sp. 73-21]|uniref:helix-turn-helix domain-containing protein n=1 Tax=Pseudonocardia sp. 73-21 TaxID=1895809 RepID=UPI0026230B45|nr:leucine zipper domain-containing protein [Pseudonocardia sp. 73-21]
MTVVEQRYRAVLAVQRGETKTDVAAQFGVSRQSVHSWCARYAADGLAGLVDRSHRPRTCPHQTTAEMEAWVCEIRREHPGWGAYRLVHEIARLLARPEVVVPSRCRAPGLMETIKPGGARNDGGATEVPRRAAGTSGPARARREDRAGQRR